MDRRFLLFLGRAAPGFSGTKRDLNTESFEGLQVSDRVQDARACVCVRVCACNLLQFLVGVEVGGTKAYTPGSTGPATASGRLPVPHPTFSHRRPLDKCNKANRDGKAHFRRHTGPEPWICHKSTRGETFGAETARVHSLACQNLDGKRAKDTAGLAAYSCTQDKTLAVAYPGSGRNHREAIFHVENKRNTAPEAQNTVVKAELGPVPASIDLLLSQASAFCLRPPAPQICP